MYFMRVNNLSATKEEILKSLPGKNCGLCGCKTCAEMAEIMVTKPEMYERCIPATGNKPTKIVEEYQPSTWKDNLGRRYDFILDKFSADPGPRETILLFNPANVKELKLKKGDVIYGRPAWISCGCPVTHVGVIVENPDYFNGTAIWCIVGPLWARKEGINIGYYNSTAYEGIVREVRKGVKLEIGRRYFFQPRYCMMQWRHSGIINAMGKTKEGMRIRIEGLLIG